MLLKLLLGGILLLTCLLALLSLLLATGLFGLLLACFFLLMARFLQLALLFFINVRLLLATGLADLLIACMVALPFLIAASLFELFLTGFLPLVARVFTLLPLFFINFKAR